MRRFHAFTLVELLVVTGIITILIGILLPTLSRARLAAKRTATLSNLKQIGASMAIYQVEFKGAFPVHVDIEAEDGRALLGLALLAGRCKLPPAVFINPNTDDTPATAPSASGEPVLAALGGVAITQTAPAAIDSGNIQQVRWHCSFAYDPDRKHTGRRFKSRVYVGDRADYGKGHSFSANWEGKGLCLLWTDQHAEYVTSKAIAEQHDPNVYHHNEYVDENGNHPGEGADEVVDEVRVTPQTLDTHLRFFSEEEDDELLPN